MQKPLARPQRELSLKCLEHRRNGGPATTLLQTLHLLAGAA
jgi:hypothetical protein